MPATSPAAATPVEKKPLLLSLNRQDCTTLPGSASPSIYPRLEPRLPYYYPPGPSGQLDYGTFLDSNRGETEAEASPEELEQRCLREASHYSRYRYYNRLFNSSHDGSRPRTEPILIIPNHVIPWYFILPKVSGPVEVSGGADRKQSSLVSIFAIWNMMMGTSLLSLPWAYHHAGLAGGLIIILAMTTLCFFTASLVIRTPKIVQVQVAEFTDLCSLLLGPVAHKISQISSLSILTGGCIVYWVLMSNFLRHLISFVYQVEWLGTQVSINISSVVCATPGGLNATGDELRLDSQSQRLLFYLDYLVPAILLVILGPIICLRSVSFFLRFNIIGTISVFYLLGFAIVKAYAWGWVHLSLDPGSINYVALFTWNFPVYTGVLSLALFIHNCLTTLMKTQRNPEHNQRDLAIAYTLVGVTYLLISNAIYISFPLAKSCIKDNFLDNFASNDLYAFITRVFLLLQVLALFPLLVYMLRIQVLNLFKDDEGRITWPWLRTITLNVLLLTACVLFATFYPQIGTIIRYCGSFSGMILIFVLPSLAFIKAREVAKKPLRICAKASFALVILFGIGNFVLQFSVNP